MKKEGTAALADSSLLPLSSNAQNFCVKFRISPLLENGSVQYSRNSILEYLVHLQSRVKTVKFIFYADAMFTFFVYIYIMSVIVEMQLKRKK